MRVTNRLFLAVAPAVLGVLTVAGLAYWGQRSHAAPHIVIITAAVAAVASLVMAWLNTRYVAQRIEQLAAKIEGPGRASARAGIRAMADAVTGRVIADAGPDELDAIESVFDRHAQALAKAEAAGEAARREGDERVREHGELLAQAATAIAHALDEIRLPLHILLENKFGDLNENQEEMLSAARAAAEAASADLRHLAEIADLDRGAITLRKDRVRLADVMQSLHPTLESEADRVQVRVITDVAPALPPVLADRGRLQEALALLLADCVRRSPKGADVRITVEASGSAVKLAVMHGAPPALDVGTVLAQRLLVAHGASIERVAGQLTVSLPATRTVETVT